MPTKADTNAKLKTSRHRKVALDVVDLSASKIAHLSSLAKRSAVKHKIKPQALSEFAAELRAKELHEWETNEEVLVLRKILLICCWSAVALFVLIPAGFSIAYAISFPDETSFKWYRL